MLDMLKLDSAQRQLAYALATAQRGPESGDPVKIEKIAGAISRMSPSQREHFLEHSENIIKASGSIVELNTYNRALKDMIHSEDLRKDSNAGELWLNENDILNGIRYFLVMDRLSRGQVQELSSAAQSGDLSTFERLLKDAGLEGHLDTAPYAVRLLNNLPDRVSKAKDSGAEVVEPAQAEGVPAVRVRQSTVEEATQVREELLDGIDTLSALEPHAASDGREKLADLAARLLTLTSLLPKTSKLRGELGVPFWKSVGASLANLGVPGFVETSGSFEVELPGLDLKQTVGTRFSLSIAQMAPALQLGRKGADPSLYRGGEDQPAILLAQDETHLGTKGAPVGFLGKDGKHIVVPKMCDTGIVEQRTVPSGIQDMPLAFDEIPRQAFYFQTRYSGVGLKLPLALFIGDVRAELRNGRYQAEGVEITAKKIGENELLLDAADRSVIVDLASGSVKEWNRK